MLYALIENGVVIQFPYTERQWRRDNPNVSMRSWEDCPLERLADIGVAPVVDENQPEFNRRTHTVTRISLPVLSEGVWVWRWEILPKNQQQIDSYDEEIRIRIRSEAQKRIDALFPPRERERRMALSLLLLEKGKPNWTGADQAIVQANREVWDSINAIRAKEDAFVAMNPPPENLTEEDWTTP